MSKIRSGFVSNSSSSSFLIVGEAFSTEAEAEEFQSKLGGRSYTYGDKFEDGTEVAGINLGGFDEDTSYEDAEDFVKKIQTAIAKCKLAGLEQPKIIGGCSYDS